MQHHSVSGYVGHIIGNIFIVILWMIEKVVSVFSSKTTGHSSQIVP